MKERQFAHFKIVNAGLQPGCTCTDYSVIGEHGALAGTISWDCARRKFCFYPTDVNTAYEAIELIDIADFIGDAMTEHWMKRRVKND